MITSRTNIRVRYADTDKMQFVYNGKYLEYFEVGRTELLRNCGLPYSQVETHGYQLPLIEAGVKYFKPARYDDLLEIEAVVKEIFSAKLTIEYSIKRSGTDDIITTGFTSHLFMKVDTQKAVRPPQFYLDKLKPLFETNVVLG
jgi:acyl-CoA thioester hydrolase